MKWYVGTSGWGYEEWQGTFYPEDTTGTGRCLELYALGNAKAFKELAKA